LIPDLRTRATEPELLDLGVPEAETRESLADLRFVNRWLGNRGALLRAVREHLPPGGRVLDVGCGSADLPVFLLSRLPGPLLAVGLDVKAFHLRAAPRTVRRVVADVRHLPFPERSFDVVTASLFLHHVPPERTPEAIAAIDRLATRGVIISDLLRSALTWGAVGALAWVAGNRIVRHDAPLSVRRAFRVGELGRLAWAASLPYLRARREGCFRVSLSGRKVAADG